MIKIRRVTVIGAGTMGRQISLQIARNDIPVVLFDIDDAVLADAKAAQERIVADWVASGIEAENARGAILGNLRYESDLSLAARDADLAIEAVPERLELKRRVFRQIDGLAREGAIIASNSSSIRVSALEDATERPEQVANLHFYLPVWDSPMVEIGGGSCTRDDVLDALSAFARAIGVLPLRVRRESTGFIFNRVWRAIKKEVMKVADSGVATVEDIDRAWMIKFGGEPPPPFAQMDRIGLDVIYDIEMRYAEESGDPDDLPRPILTEKVERGELGQKTGRGFYNYPDPAYAAEDFLDPDASE
ncbi:MAG: 3-hydroxyacyl-CoA dehydrogenase family protein [Chloroflexi bacterium]|nr:3-hydroxyacyl-CoA dehydrogenase family protein [Chloroflexota bacterium]